MERPEPVETARRLVREHFPEARQAWLSGSVVLGGATATSDLDVTVLRAEGEQVFRESMVFAGWPVELFVHTPTSVRRYVAKDLARRSPSMARLVAAGVPLLDGDAGAELQAECRAILDAGPPALTDDELALERYGLTDLLDDLADAEPGPILTATAVATWRVTAELALALAGAWRGSGKWLARELVALDVRTGGDLAPTLDDALKAAVAGDVAPLTRLADAVLDRVGGRLWDGYRAEAPPTTAERKGPMAVSLREITDANAEAVAALSVSEAQQRFVSSVTESLEEAEEHPQDKPWFRAVYADERPVGFVMLSWDVEPRPPEIHGPWFLWKLLIDERHQGHGYGRDAVRLVADLVRDQGGRELLTSHVVGEGGPAGFYARLGFEPTGETDPDGEVILRLAL